MYQDKNAIYFKILQPAAEQLLKENDNIIGPYDRHDFADVTGVTIYMISDLLQQHREAQKSPYFEAKYHFAARQYGTDSQWWIIKQGDNTWPNRQHAWLEYDNIKRQISDARSELGDSNRSNEVRILVHKVVKRRIFDLRIDVPYIQNFVDLSELDGLADKLLNGA